ncbi:MAG: hypothetical protein OIF50_04190 [Flavobacteriaceae bacterium]|nr:hypothetical protein [Flavobacteriaceae bacterium]
MFYHYEDDRFNHYNKPAFITNIETRRGFAIMEGVLFEWTKLPLDVSKFNIAAFLVPTKSKDSKKKKKGGFFKKLKVKMSGNPLIKEFI